MGRAGSTGKDSQGSPKTAPAGDVLPDIRQSAIIEKLLHEVGPGAIGDQNQAMRIHGAPSKRMDKGRAIIPPISPACNQIYLGRGAATADLTCLSPTGLLFPVQKQVNITAFDQ
jgi:hypothetical protein